MTLTADQIQELLNIIDKNQLVVIGTQFGPDFLSTIDKELLTKYGVEWDRLYDPSLDFMLTNFHFGMLAESLIAADVNKFTFDELKEYIKRGDYIPLTGKEIATLNAFKNQTCNDIKTLGRRIFQDVNNYLNNGSLQDQKNFIVQEMMEGYLDKKTVSEIAHSIAEKTGDWSRDFDRIVAYNTHKAIEEGKATMIERNAGDPDVLVYKDVMPGACKHCVELYLTNGIGSKPRLFKLSELRANGTNVGRKVSEWKATLGPIHPYCRCALRHYNKKDTGSAPKRKPIRVWIGGVEQYV